VLAFEIELSYACALIEGGKVVCDGRPIEGLSAVERIHVGERFACASTADRALWCWGYDQAGQRGQRKATDGGKLPPAQLMTDDGKPWLVDDFAVGEAHTCVLSGGEVSCFGAMHDLVPKVVFRNARRVFAGKETTCATDAKDQLYCWGDQDGGYNHHSLVSTPTRIATPAPVKAMAFGGGHSCVLLTDGHILCRGWNPGGQLGSAVAAPRTGDSDFQPKFVPIPQLPNNYLDVAAARDETCVVTLSNQLICLGTPAWLDRPGHQLRLDRDGQCVTWKDSKTAPCVPATDPTFAPGSARVAAATGRRCVLDLAGVLRCVGEHGRVVADLPFEPF
jgi:hypothetical protein